MYLTEKRGTGGMGVAGRSAVGAAAGGCAQPVPSARAAVASKRGNLNFFMQL